MATPIDAIHFPFRIDRGSGELLRERDYNRYIRMLIEQVLFTAPGERINRPDFGAGIRQLVFAPNSPATASLAQTLIFQGLNEWLGTLIVVDKVEVTAEGAKMNILVAYTVIARAEREFLNVEVTL